MKMKLFKVGGCVRDSVMDRPCNDIDLSVEAESYAEMREGVLAMGGEIFVENEEFLTIRAKTPQFGATDFVLCRKDGAYKDGRRPESVEMGTIQDDLARRDFTMNAIAQDVETGFLIDPFDGVNDITRGLIKCVGNAEERLNEDALRVFRAIRFAVVLGFDLYYPTAQAIKGVKDYSGVATERIRDELLKMFKHDTFQSVTWLKELDLVSLVKERGIWLKPTTEKA